MPNQVDIIIQMVSQLQQLQSTISALTQITGSVQKNTAAANEWFQALKVGLGLNFGNLMLQGLTEVRRAYSEMLATSVSFNAQLETSRLGIAAIMRSMAPDRVGDFNKALKISDSLLAELKAKSLESATGYGELVELFQIATPAMTRANIPLEKQVQLAVLLANAGKTLGIGGTQLARDTRDMLSGMGARTMMAAALNISPAEIAQATASGQLYDFLTQKLNGFKESVDESQKSYAVLVSNLEQTWKIQLADAGSDYFTEKKRSIKALTDLLNEPATKSALELMMKVPYAFEYIKRTSLETFGAFVSGISAGMAEREGATPAPTKGNGGVEDLGPAPIKLLGPAANQQLTLKRDLFNANTGADQLNNWDNAPSEKYDQVVAGWEKVKEDLIQQQADVGSKFKDSGMYGPDGKTFTEDFSKVSEDYFKLQKEVQDVEDKITKTVKDESEKRRKEREKELDLAIEGLGGFAEASKAFGRSGFAAYKAFAIAESLVATYLAATRALGENPQILNYIAAAGVTAAGLANVATIASQNYSPGYKMGGYTGDGDPNQIAGPAHRGEFYFTAAQTRAIGVDTLRGLARGPTATIPAPNVSVTPTPVKFALVPQSRSELIRLIQEDPQVGRAILKLTRKERMAIGMPAA